MPGELTGTDWGTELHVLCAFVSVLSIAGTFGNVLILLVYRKWRDKRATNVFIGVLAVLDLIVCLVVMPYTIIYEYGLVTADFACKVCELMRHINVIMSNFTLVAVAVERYLAICRPTVTVLSGVVKKAMALMLVFSTFLAAPPMWIFAVVSRKCFQHASNVTNASTVYVTTDALAYCQFTTTLLGPTLTLVYQGTTAVLYFIIVIVLIVLYAFVYRKVWNQDKVRNKARISTTVWITGQNGARQATIEAAGVNTPQKRQATLNEIFTLKRLSNVDVNDTKEGKSPLENNEISDLSDGVKVTGNISRTVAPVINLPSRKRNVHRMTGTMLFICTIVYTLTWMPFWLDIFGVTHSLVFRHMFFISNASNPIIYGIVNKQMRNSLTKIMCRQKVLPENL